MTPLNNILTEKWIRGLRSQSFCLFCEQRRTEFLRVRKSAYEMPQ